MSALSVATIVPGPFTHEVKRRMAIRNPSSLIIGDARSQIRNVIPRTRQPRTFHRQLERCRLACGTQRLSRTSSTAVAAVGAQASSLERNRPLDRSRIGVARLADQRSVIQKQFNLIAVCVDLNLLIMRLQIRRRPVREDCLSRTILLRFIARIGGC